MTWFTFTHSWLKRHVIFSVLSSYQILHSWHIYFGRKIPTSVIRSCQECFCLCSAFPTAMLPGWAPSRQSLKNNKLCCWNGAQVLHILLKNGEPLHSPAPVELSYIISCILGLLLGLGKCILTCVIKCSNDKHFNRMLAYDVIKKMTILPYFPRCCTKSLCHYYFITLGWSIIYFNTLKDNIRIQDWKLNLQFIKRLTVTE